MEQNIINPQVELQKEPETANTPPTETTNIPNGSLISNTPEAMPPQIQPTGIGNSEVPKKNMSVVLLISIIILIISIVVIAVFLLKNVIKIPTLDSLQVNTQSQTSTSIPTSTPREALKPISIEGWKIYTNNVLKYTIRYPSDWSIDVSKAELPINGNNVQEISIYKDSYKLTIIWPTAYGPTICYFDDQVSSQMQNGANFCRGEFVEYKGDNDLITYRRLLSPTLKNDLQSWTVFTKSNNYFVGLPPITMLAPKTYSENEVSIMDKVVSTLRYLEAHPYYAGTEATSSSGGN